MDSIGTSFSLYTFPCITPPHWSGGRASVSREAGLGSSPAFAVGLLPGRVTPVTSKLVLQWLSCLAPGVMSLALGLVGRGQYTVTG